MEWSQSQGTIFSNPPWPEKLVAHFPASFQSICKSATGRHGCQTPPRVLVYNLLRAAVPWRPSGLDSVLPLQGAWVPSLELTFQHAMQHSQKENFLRTHQTLRVKGWG